MQTNRIASFLAPLLLFVLIIQIGCTDEMMEEVKREIGDEVSIEYEKAKEELKQEVVESKDRTIEEAKSGFNDFFKNLTEDTKDWFKSLLGKNPGPNPPDQVQPGPNVGDPDDQLSKIDRALIEFFTNSINTESEDWSNRNITEMWSRISGDRAQFQPNRPNNIDREWKTHMPDEVYEIYQDLAQATLRKRETIVTTGFAYDAYYYNNYKNTHEGLDMSATNGTLVTFFAKGKVHNILNLGENGWFLYIDELDNYGNFIGRRWKFGHLQRSDVSIGQEVNSETVLGTVGQSHLHLAVMNAPYTDIGYYYTGNYNQDVAYILQHRISPIYGYWLSKNQQ